MRSRPSVTGIPLMSEPLSEFTAAMGLSVVALTESCGQVLAMRTMQIIEDLQGVPPGLARIPEVADGGVVVSRGALRSTYVSR